MGLDGKGAGGLVESVEREEGSDHGRGGCEGEQGIDYKGPRRSWKGRCLCSGSGPRDVVGWQDMEGDTVSRGMLPEFVSTLLHVGKWSSGAIQCRCPM